MINKPDRATAKLTLAATLALAASSADAQELFSVNFWSVGGGSTWDDINNVLTLTLASNEAAGLWETTNWQNINFGNPFSTSTPTTTIRGSEGSTALFTMPQRRNSSPYYWNAVRDDSDTVHVGNATLLDAHVAATEDPYDGSATAQLQFNNIPFEVYDVVI